MRKAVILLICLHFLISGCNKKEEGTVNEPDFNIDNIDTLRSDIVNVKKIEYNNLNYEKFNKRYIELLYVISDSVFDGDMSKLENYTYGGLKDVRINDTLEIYTSKEKGDKIISFLIYDEVQLPSYTKSTDSVNLKSTTTTFFLRTYIK